MLEASPPHPAAIDPDRLLRQCQVRRRRGSGPGGQRRNKVETAIELIHQPTGITASASERRHQAQNQRVALFRLRVNLAMQVRTRAANGEPAPPSDLWRQRARGGRMAVNPGHDDFPALLAEALDAIAACDADVKAAAEPLGCSTSQLVRLLKLEPAALEQVNAWRAARDLHALR